MTRDYPVLVECRACSPIFHSAVVTLPCPVSWELPQSRRMLADSCTRNRFRSAAPRNNGWSSVNYCTPLRLWCDGWIHAAMSQSGYTRVASRLSCDMRALKVLDKYGLLSWLMRCYQDIRLGISLCVWQWCRLVIDPLLSVIWAIRLSDIDSSNTSLSGSKPMRDYIATWQVEINPG